MEPVKGEQGTKRLEFEIAQLDFISRLPEAIIHYIFSFLHARDVTSTSILSKTWNRFWSNYPFVVFHFAYNNDAPEQELLGDNLLMRTQKEDFLYLMEKSICHRLGKDFPIQRFQLYTDFPDFLLLSPKMDQWISMVVQRNTAELALSLHSSTGSLRSYYRVPQAAFLAASFIVLIFSGCRFEGSLIVELPRLQKLSLSQCHFADKFTFNRILSGCPVIEYVKVSSCRWMDTLLCVSGLPHLKYFEFIYADEVHDIKVDLCNLHTFSLGSHLGHWPSSSSIDLTTCKALKELKLKGRFFGNDFMLQSLVSQLPALEVLELHNLTGSVGSTLSSRRLRKLVFSDCRHLDLIIDTPNLESFEYCNCDTPFIPINASNALQIHLRFSLRGNSVDWLVKLKHFLLKSSNIEDLKIIIYHRFENMIIHDKLSEVGFSSLCNFIQPSYICISSRSYTDLLDELFPLAYPQFMYVIHSNRNLIQMLSERMEDLRRDRSLARKLVGFRSFELDDTSEDTTHKFKPATEVFIKAHSNGLFKTSAIKLEWNHLVPRGRITL